jgi:hypothetical protein
MHAEECHVFRIKSGVAIFVKTGNERIHVLFVSKSLLQETEYLLLIWALALSIFTF